MEIDRTVLFGGRDQPRVLVLGLGESGLAMARWCASHGCSLRLADSRVTPPNLAVALALPSGPHAFVSVPGDPFALSVLDDDIGLIAISPGLSPLDPPVAALLAAAAERGIAVWGELEFFSHALRALPEPRAQVIAITGTNGKTTTTALTGQLVERAGCRVAVAGNISPSMLDRLQEALANDVLPEVWVLELSSFQLETAYTFAPDAAAVLNVTQDHLDWHGGFEAYARAKFRIFGPHTRIVLNRGDAVCQAWLRDVSTPRGAGTADTARKASPTVSPTLSPTAATVITIGTDAPPQVGDFGIAADGGLNWLAQAVNAEGLDGVDARGVEGEAAKVVASRRRSTRGAQVEKASIKPLMPVDALRIRGLHNATNAMAALALCRAIGLSLAPLLHGLRDYRGEPHRVESIAVIDGVDYVDDSKATNVGATVAALDGLASRVILIAGGDGKGQDFSPLLPVVSRWCKTVLLIGRDAPLLREALHRSDVPMEDHDSLESATADAARQAVSGDVVLLSPACASLDMFRNYAHRAEVFRQGVAEIAAVQGVTI